MKTLFMILVATLFPVMMFGQEKTEENFQLAAKFQVAMAIENGVDVSQRSIVSNQNVCFYTTPDYSGMVIVTLTPRSQKNGVINNWEFRNLIKEDEHDPDAEATFLWYYHFDEHKEPARCRLLFHNTERGMIYHLYIETEEMTMEYGGC